MSVLDSHFLEQWLQQLTPIDDLSDRQSLSTNTMSLALPVAVRSYVNQRVASGQFGSTSEYLRELIRRGQEEQAKKRIRELIEEGLSSGRAARALTPQRLANLKKQAGLRELKSARLQPLAEADLIAGAQHCAGEGAAADIGADGHRVQARCGASRPSPSTIVLILDRVAR